MTGAPVPGDATLPALRAAAAGCEARERWRPGIRVLRERGRFLGSDFRVTAMPTVHPSSVLRAPDAAARERAYADFLADLRRAAAWLRD